MDLGLSDKVVIVTGGAGAIGSAAAARFLEEGAIVVLGDRDEGKLRSVAGKLLSRYPGRADFRFLDLANEANIRAFVTETIESRGGIDCIVNNAAVFYFDKLVDWESLDPLDQHFQVGLRGPVTLVQESWRQSDRSQSGSVVNISSVAGHVAEPDAVAYTTIKAAQKGLTLSCSIEMAKYGGWSVSISPGHTWTPVHQERARVEGMSREEYEASQPHIQSSMIGRFLDPDEIANWIVLAASPLGRALTGQDIRVTGGIEPGGFNRNYKTATN